MEVPPFYFVLKVEFNYFEEVRVIMNTSLKVIDKLFKTNLFYEKLNKNLFN